MEQLTKEALELIQETAVKASGAIDKVDFRSPVGEPDHVYYVVTPDGKHERFEATPETELSYLGSLDQVGPLVDFLVGSERAPMVWYNDRHVVIIHQHDERRAQTVLQLRKTPELKDLENLGDVSWSQTEMVRLLRVKLRSCLPDNRLLEYVREVSFEGQRSGGGSIQPGRESMGADIHEAAVNADECPRELDLAVRIFDDPSQTQTWAVRCDVEILVSDQKFRITPFPLELKNAIDKEVSAIGAQLVEDCPDGVPIFRGSP